MKLSVLFLFIFISALNYAQTANTSTGALIDSLPLRNNCAECKPVVYAANKSDYPFMVTFSGEIIAATAAAVPCDAICNAGTIAVRIISKTPTPPFVYKHDTIFVSLPCFYINPEDYIGRTVNMTVFKLENFNDDCFQNITNKIDSRGIPFYYTNILKEDLIEIESFIKVQGTGVSEVRARVLKSTYCEKFDKLALEQARWKFIANNFKDTTYKIILLVNKESITLDCFGLQKIPLTVPYKSLIEVRAINTTKGGKGKEVEYYTLIINELLETYYVDTQAIFSSENFDSVKIVHQKKDRWQHIYLTFKDEFKKTLLQITANLEGVKLGLFINGKFISFSEIRGVVRGGVIQFELHYPETIEYIKKAIPGIKTEEYSK